MNTIKLTLLFLLITLSAKSQEMLGIANSNYAGVTGINLNPSSMVGCRLVYDVNIIGGDLFVENNYVYMPRLYQN